MTARTIKSRHSARPALMKIDRPAMAWGRQGDIVLGSRGILREGRLRWLRSLAWMIGLLVITAAVLSLQAVVKAFVPAPSVTLAMAFVCTILAYCAYFLLVHRGERRWPCELALKPLIPEYALGFLSGCLIVVLTVGALWLFGLYEITRGSWTDWPHDLRETIGTGLLEELLARLIVFRLLSRAFGVPAGFLLSAAAFGAAHLANANASPLSAIAIAIEAGLLFAGFYFVTGRIWMSCGIHAGWNLMLGGFFGAPVSGMIGKGSFLVSLPKPGSAEMLTGGAFGPEGSVPAMVFGLAAFLVTLRLAGRPAQTEVSI